MFPKRGELWWANLGQGSGSEQQGTRPVLIIQNNVGNRFSTTTIVAAITDADKKPIPTHVQLGNDNGLPNSSTVMLEQIRTIDKERLESKIGDLSQTDMRLISKAIRISVGLVDDW
ncbi:type II toxin-antitoxin system PemK/MazF family toxin [Paenibacillus anaericanus]|uniref:mRNA interferase n=1 Tax=Paenibacillus anaericanus TaxID=170367 RepID=A0A433YFX4_9BACL|nr:type II toxin-antitoxin system PemK/MazF family toxin [Paenibacillus anaericanus]